MKLSRGAPFAAPASLMLAATLATGCRDILGVEDGTLRESAGGSGSEAGTGGSGGTSVAGAANNPSCKGLARTCGPTENSDCCAPGAIPGGTFRRSYDGKTFPDSRYRATVSNFVLDKYEATVGRFQKFMAEYSQNMLAQGAGKNPNDAGDPGWDSAWNANLPADVTALACDVYATFSGAATPPCERATHVPDESSPITGVTWYVAFAFCVWDGGRLPTEAEWNYAAAGGDEQRAYPWGTAAPDGTRAIANLPEATTPERPERVGSTSPNGDGKWGHSDLAGNVEEWNLDWYFSPYAQTECVDCANTAEASTEPYPARVVRGGGYWADAPVLLSSYRSVADCSMPACSSILRGVRCARSAP